MVGSRENVNTNNRKAIAKSVARRRYRYRTPV